MFVHRPIFFPTVDGCMKFVLYNQSSFCKQLKPPVNHQFCHSLLSNTENPEDVPDSYLLGTQRNFFSESTVSSFLHAKHLLNIK